jgi:hypothetical protein
MNFDFYEKYKEYSNIELLKIIRQHGAYQAEAIDAASQILSSRQIESKDRETVDHYFQNIELKEKARQGKINSYKDKARDFLEPILEPSENIKPAKWLSILLLYIGLQWAWSFYETVKHFINILKCRYCEFDIFFLAEFLTLIYLPIIFFLLFKRRRWGWILLFADNLFILISRTGQSYIFFKYQSVHQSDTASFIFPIVLRTIFAFFLWRDPITDFFGVTKEIKKRTALVTGSITAGLLFLLNVIFYR